MLLSVVIPCHNEQKNVTRLAKAFHESFKGEFNKYEIIWVNDGSTDNTLTELLDLQKKDPSHHVVVDLTINQGQTAALMAGIGEATGEFIATIDGDMESHPRELVSMVKVLRANEQLDMIVGWRQNRWVGEGMRRQLSLVANKMINFIFPLTEVHDAGCPVKVARASVFKDMKLYGELHRFITHLAIRQGARVHEVPVDFTPRTIGQTHYGFSRTFKVFFDLIMIRSLMLNRRTPPNLFSLLFSLSLLGGAVSFVAVLAMKLIFHVDVTGNPLLTIGVFLSILAGQFMVLGLVMEMSMRIYYESTGNTPYRVRKVHRNN